MKIYINDKNEIKDVHSTTDTSLREIIINDENNPFEGWSVAKMCCHAIYLNNEEYAGFYPYVDSKLIKHIDDLGKANETNATDITNMQLAICDIYESTL